MLVGLFDQVGFRRDPVFGFNFRREIALADMTTLLKQCLEVEEKLVGTLDKLSPRVPTQVPQTKLLDAIPEEESPPLPADPGSFMLSDEFSCDCSYT
jgi:hypothetical protein